MVEYNKVLTLSNQGKLWLVCLFFLAWMSFAAWRLAWPLTWLSLPILLCFGYLTLRIIFELTINRKQVPTLATCFVARQKVATILQHEASISEKDAYTIIDLGSGRGELTRCIAKKIPKAKIIGIEMSRLPHMFSCLMQRIFGPKNVTYKNCDFWPYDCSNVDAVFLYLSPLTAPSVGSKLYKELQKGSVVISHSFPLLGEWSPIEVQNFKTPFKETLYIYKR